MTKMHFQHAAEIVRAILAGEWTDSAPAWADRKQIGWPGQTEDFVRAVQTAEAFILLFRAYNPRFDEQRFLQACELVDKSAKKRRV